MWYEILESGKCKFTERYIDPMTEKQKFVSITMNKYTTQNEKKANKVLLKRIEDKIGTSTTQNITLETLVKEYRIAQKGEVKESTYLRNYHTANTLLGLLGKDTLVNKLSASYVIKKFKASKKDGSTLNELRIRFGAIIRWGYKHDFVEDKSFLDKIDPFREDVSRKERIQDKFLESDQLNRIIEYFTDKDLLLYAYVTKFLALTGLRIGEMAALSEQDVDLENRLIHITKTYDTGNQIVTSTKTLCSIRDIYIQDELLEVLREMKPYLLRRRLLLGYVYNEDIFIPGDDGARFHYDAYRKMLKKAALSIAGKELTPHALRHTHASLLLAEGMSIDAVARRLGHEDSKVTREIYTHIVEKLKKKEYEQIKDVRIM